MYHLVLVSNQLLSPRNYNAGIFPLELWKWADRGIREGGNCITMKKVVSLPSGGAAVGEKKARPFPSSHSSSRLTINQPKGAITASAVNEMARGKRHLASPCRATGLPGFLRHCLIWTGKALLDELKVGERISFWNLATLSATHHRPQVNSPW